MRKEKGKVILVALIILLDQLSKFLVAESDLAVINKGVFFGRFEISFLGILGVLGILGILGEKYNFPWSLVLVTAGGISNLIDRIFRGGVIDYINIKIIPVFNLADVMICSGLVIFLIDFALKRRV